MLRVNESKFGIIFTTSRIKGKGKWDSARGLIKKVALKEDVYIVDITWSDLTKIYNNEADIMSIIRDKYNACHTTSPDNAIKIFASGKLLSALNARKVPVEELMAEKRNAANDPADYFEYVMLAWGNCQAGDRLVMERKLGRFPDEEDLSVNFTPGVRFYFKYDKLVRHPQVVFDGVLPMKVKDEIVLRDWVDAIVIPTELREIMGTTIPRDLSERVIYIENNCKDIWEWSEKVYCIIEKM